MDKILINNETYTYQYYGECLKCEPKMEEYSITPKDIQAYSDYKSKISSYEYDVHEAYESNMHVVAMILASIISLICTISYAYKMFTTGEHLILCLFVVILETPFLGLILYTILNLIFMVIVLITPKQVLNLFSKHILPYPQYNIKYDSVIAYKNAQREYFKYEREYDKRYPEIRKNNYDIIEHGKDNCHKLVSLIIEHYKNDNIKIQNNNERKKQEWWTKLNPYQFEEEVAKWFRSKGYDAEVTSKSGDEGKDIIIKKKDYIGYVQCKRYTTSKVDRPTLNALYGVVCADNVTQGIIVCLKGLTKEAAEFAEKTNIKVYTIEDLAPNNLFSPIKPTPLIDISITKNNETWCKIGDIYVNTVSYETQELAFSHTEKWNDKEKYFLVCYRGLYHFITGDAEKCKKIMNDLH